jgi:hypothetical protein
MRKAINYEVYLKMNKQVNKVARDNGLEFIRSYGHYGPRVRRTKLWGIGWRHSRAHINLVVYKLSGLPNVQFVENYEAKIEPYGYLYLPYIYVRYY